MSRVELNQRNIEKFAQALVHDTAKDTQKVLDRVYRSHHGSRVDQVERVLLRELRHGPVDYGKDTIRSWAQLIADNTQIKLRAS